MITEYVRIAFRHLRNQKLFTFTNIFGLSLGLAFAILIYLFIRDEYRFDRFHSNTNEIYSLRYNWFEPSIADKRDPYRHSRNLSAPLGEAIKTGLTGVKYVTFFIEGESSLQHADFIQTSRCVYVDTDFFKMFSFSLLKGDSTVVFKQPYEAVITDELALKMFGDEDPLGKVINIGYDKIAFTVSGVIESPPAYSTLDFDILLQKEHSPAFNDHKDNWHSRQFPIFIQAEPNADSRVIEQSITKLLHNGLGSSFFDQKKNEYKMQHDFHVANINLINLANIHLDTTVHWPKGSKPLYSIILASITLLIILIASVNYVSVSLMSSIGRKLEVGIRKVNGANPSQIMLQFMLESITVTLIASFVALVLAWLFMPYFNSFTNKEIAFTNNEILAIGSTMIALVFCVALLAGGYPSFYLSKLLPVEVLKKGFTKRLNSILIQPLVVFQFGASLFLIISSIAMYQQMKLVRDKELGFHSEAILSMPVEVNTIDRFKTMLLDRPEIISIAGTTSSFGQGLSIAEMEINGKRTSLYRFSIDQDCLDLLKIQLKEGRNFNEHDKGSVIVNETLAIELGWEDPLQEKLMGHFQVVGVVKDFHFQSLESSIKPMYWQYENANNLWTMLVRLEPTQIEEGLKILQTTWKEVLPGIPFQFTFLDQDIANQYASHNRWTSIVQVSAILALLIYGFGLFGLAGLNSVNAIKGISIRKVLGASHFSLFVQQNWPYLKLSILAFILSIPFCWYFINLWLDNFHYKIQFDWTLISFGFFVSLIISIGTVSYHTLKTTLTNPSEILKHE